MQQITEKDVLKIWELARNQHSLKRALIILAVADPKADVDTLARLSKGQRDQKLIKIREQLFGSSLPGWIQCIKCQEKLEINLDASVFKMLKQPELINKENHLNYNSYKIIFRLPNSLDLAAVLKGRNPLMAKEIFLNRCIIKANRKGKKVAIARLPKKVVQALQEKMAELDPWADIKLKINCSFCKSTWQFNFDIASYLWKELSALARSIFNEIHLLARYYGWSESEILSMMPARRKIYVEMTA